MFFGTVRGSYDSNAQLRFRRQPRGSRGGARGKRGAVRSQSVLIVDADGARADRSAGAQALHVLRQPALRGRPRALPAAHGLLRHARRSRGVAERGARDLSGCLGRRGSGAQAARARRRGRRRAGAARRRPAGAGACVPPARPASPAAAPPPRAVLPLACAGRARRSAARAGRATRPRCRAGSAGPRVARKPRQRCRLPRRPWRYPAQRTAAATPPRRAWPPAPAQLRAARRHACCPATPLRGRPPQARRRARRLRRSWRRPPGQSPAGGRGPAKPVFEDSNVREVLKALGDASATGETRQMQVAAAAARGHRRARRSQRHAGAETARDAPRRGQRARCRPRRADGGAIPLLKPDDTGTRRALKEAVASNAPVCLRGAAAVVGAAGRARQGAAARDLQRLHAVHRRGQPRRPQVVRAAARILQRRDLGQAGGALRALGVRLGGGRAGESAGEGARHRSGDGGDARSAGSRAHRRHGRIQADRRGAPRRRCRLVPAPPKAARRKPARLQRAPLRAAAAAAKGRARGSGKVGARDRRGPHTLEETLEILGAGQLSIDNGNGETLNDSGVRHLHVEVQKNSPFSKLLERLSERLKRP